MCVRFSDLEGARIGVWGAGREIGSFAAQLTRRLPAARILAAAFDTPPAEDIASTLGLPGPRVLSAAEAAEGLAGCEVVVRSPGVPVHRMELEQLRASGVTVTTATALWLAERGGAGVIGVTGTKGKSTTAALLHHLLRASGRSARLAGNIGVPALDLLDEDLAELVVLELSSYQIADLSNGPEVALFTNLYREHTDWHGSEAAYRADKLRLLELPGVRRAVLNARDETLAALRPPVEVLPYGLPRGWDVEEGQLLHNGVTELTADQLPLPGEHNALNLCGALTALEAIHVELPPLPDALEGFRALPHRLETVRESAGVTWVNDSISTTPESTLAALASFPGRGIILIGGGQDRGQDYTALGQRLAELGATIIGVPSTGPRLAAATLAAGAPAAEVLQADSLEDALRLARPLARAGDVILLSPGAPSYDNFRNFEERGELFRELAGAC
jgi:UDP-N-acetylmuramoylalanine--D-glutamate ligase